MHTVLIVDDHLAILDFMRDALDVSGFRVLTASSGPEGLALARDNAPDLILMDMTMPHMSGVEAVGRLREDPCTRRIPVVALTGGTSLAAGELMRAGCIGYIAKPVGVEDLRQQVAEFIRITARRPRPGEPRPPHSPSTAEARPLP
jgi:CheY-like chemotaxis protein